ncbi:MAG TPA: hypothetical protein VF989_15820, partial [Polyangiaceae bacterium]
PTYEAGRLAARGIAPAASSTAAYAWRRDGSSLELPYFYRWSFRTGLRGDFEYALRQLKARTLPDLGVRDLDCADAGFGLPPLDRDAFADEPELPHGLRLEGALKAPATRVTSWGADDRSRVADFRRRLAELLNRAAEPLGDAEIVLPGSNLAAAVRLSEDGTSLTAVWAAAEASSSAVAYLNAGKWQQAQGLAFGGGFRATLRAPPGGSYPIQFSIDDLEPVKGTLHVPAHPWLLPPTYGRWHAARAQLSLRREAPRWLDELNLDPRHRAAAALGASVVRKHQEALMESAWKQLGAIESGNDIVRRAQLGREVGNGLFRRLDRLSDSDFLAVAGPILDRARSGCKSGTESGVSLEQRLIAGQVPRGAFDPALRRAARRVRSGGLHLRLLRGELYRGAGAGTPRESAFAAGDHWLQRVQQHPSHADGAGAGLLQLAESIQKLVPTYPPIAGEVKDDLRCAIDPEKTVCERTRTRLHFSKRLPRECLDRIMAAPEFPQPLYELLLESSKQHLLPGIEKIPQNTITLLETNRRFVEAFIMGCNHELGSELLWREYPTDQRGSYFRQFWDPSQFLPEQTASASERAAVLAEAEGRLAAAGLQPTPEALAAEQRAIWEERKKDVRALHDWAGRLGHNRVPEAPPERAVLLIRGDLLKKFPDAEIYAVPAVTRLGDDAAEEVVPALPEHGVEPALLEMDENRRRDPIFSVKIPADITLLGFDFTEDQARGGGENGRGIFFVFEEKLAEIRFGLDEPPDAEEGFPATVTEWDDLTWNHFRTAVGEYIHFPENGAGPIEIALDSAGSAAGPARVLDKKTSAATLVWMTTQKSFRLAIHATRLLRTSS